MSENNNQLNKSLKKKLKENFNDWTQTTTSHGKLLFHLNIKKTP